MSPGEDEVCYTYILECADGTFYTGWTTDLDRRLEEHNQGLGARYTRSRLPVRLHYREQHRDRSSAMQREYQLKQLSHREKARMAAQA
jgi:putative endonuclease